MMLCVYVCMHAAVRAAPCAICICYTVDPKLSGPQVSGCLDYPNWVVTVQLEYFVKGFGHPLSLCF